MLHSKKIVKLAKRQFGERYGGAFFFTFSTLRFTMKRSNCDDLSGRYSLDDELIQVIQSKFGF